MFSFLCPLQMSLQTAVKDYPPHLRGVVRLISGSSPRSRAHSGLRLIPFYGIANYMAPRIFSGSVTISIHLALATTESHVDAN